MDQKYTNNIMKTWIQTLYNLDENFAWLTQKTE